MTLLCLPCCLPSVTEEVVEEMDLMGGSGELVFPEGAWKIIIVV